MDKNHPLSFDQQHSLVERSINTKRFVFRIVVASSFFFFLPSFFFWLLILYLMMTRWNLWRRRGCNKYPYQNTLEYKTNKRLLWLWWWVGATTDIILFYFFIIILLLLLINIGVLIIIKLIIIIITSFFFLLLLLGFFLTKYLKPPFLPFFCSFLSSFFYLTQLI